MSLNGRGFPVGIETFVDAGGWIQAIIVSKWQRLPGRD